MFYTILGRIVWSFAKRRLRSRRPGGRSLAGAGVAAALGAGALVARRLRAR